MTVRELKIALHGWLSCEDEAKRDVSSVEVVVGDQPLLNDQEMLSEDMGPVLAFFSVKPVTCSSFQASRNKCEDLRVVLSCTVAFWQA